MSVARRGVPSGTNDDHTASPHAMSKLRIELKVLDERARPQ